MNKTDILSLCGGNIPVGEVRQICKRNKGINREHRIVMRVLKTIKQGEVTDMRGQEERLFHVK